MAASTVLKAGALIRTMLPGRKQPRIYSVVKVGREGVTLRLAWAEEGKTFPVLGKAKTFPKNSLRGTVAYTPDETAEVES